MSSNSISTRSSDKLKEKRKLSPTKEDETQIENTIKKSKSCRISKREMEEIEKIIKKSLLGVTNKITEAQESLDNKITQMGNTISNEFKTEIDALKSAMDSFQTDISNRVSCFETELDDHNKRLTNNEDDIDRVTLLSQLRITGYPYKDDENLNDLFTTIANEIGYSMIEPSKVPMLRRLPFTKNGITSGSNTILMYFVAQHYKDNFYSLYLHRAPLKPESLGMPSNMRIIIGENLTKRNAALFSFCNAMKRENKLAQAYTSNGLIYVKFQRGRQEKAYNIRHERDLEILIQRNENLIVNNLPINSNGPQIIQTNQTLTTVNNIVQNNAVNGNNTKSTPSPMDTHTNSANG